MTQPVEPRFRRCARYQPNPGAAWLSPGTVAAMALGINLGVLLGMLRVVRTTGMPKSAPVGDWQSRRELTERYSTAVSALATLPANIAITTAQVPRLDGGVVEVRMSRPSGVVGQEDRPRGALIYVHGGGLIAGAAKFTDAVCATYAKEADALVISVDYGLSPEHRYPHALDDIATVLHWAYRDADMLGIDRARIGIAGDSAGGGLAAAAALQARDLHRSGLTDLTLCCQLLVYPMLDYRTVPGAAASTVRSPWLIWSYADNITGWDAYLGSDLVHANAMELIEAAPYASASHAPDVTDLPPTFIDVGSLDIFLAEDSAYAQRLTAAGVSTEFHVYDKVPHGFDDIAPESSISRRAWNTRYDFLRQHLAS